MIPEADWSRESADVFSEAAGLNNVNYVGQRFVCVSCVRQGNENPPTSIAMVNGTTLCPEHIDV